jgi:hypothetical protein
MTIQDKIRYANLNHRDEDTEKREDYWEMKYVPYQPPRYSPPLWVAVCIVTAVAGVIAAVTLATG